MAEQEHGGYPELPLEACVGWRRNNIFYGWVIVALSGMAMVSAMVGHTTGK